MLPALDEKAMIYKCSVCQMRFSRKSNLNRHFMCSHDPKFGGFNCKNCNKSFSTKCSMKRHFVNCSTKIQTGGNLFLSSPSSSVDGHNHENETENVDLPPENDSEILTLSALVRSRWSAIRSYFKCQKIMDVFNFRLFQQNAELKNVLSKIWLTKINSQVKLQCSLGFVLQHKTSHKLRYFHSSANNASLFRNAKHIGSLGDLLKICDLIEQTDLMQHALAQRPNSEWTVLRLTNLTFFLSKLQFSKFGSPNSLPDYIKSNRSILSLESNGHKKFDDNLCFFRALALAISCQCQNRCYCIRKIQPCVEKLFDIYVKSKKLSISSHKFTGVTLNELPYLESLFKVKVTVFTLKKNSRASILFQSFKSFPLKLNLCAVNNHFCYVRDVAKFAKCFQCKNCSTSFSLSSRLAKHSKTCAKNMSKLSYKGDYFFPPKSIFEQIEEETNIAVNSERRFYPYFATYDIECFLASPSEPDTNKMSFSSEHTLMSISICSNIPGYTVPFCIVSNGCVDSLVEKFVLYLEHLSSVAKNLCLQNFSDVFNGLKLFSDMRSLAETKYEQFQWSSPQSYHNKSICNLIKKFEGFCSELPIIGFNSQKYDINCMRAPLIRFLLKHDKIQFAIKRNNVMKCIKTQNLKFLDILNFIAPGFTYESFIKAYNCEMEKGFFPYEYVTSLEILNETTLPPHDAFYSRLKQSNISVQEYNQCKRVWDQLKMKTLKDYLIYYNNLDVAPFIEAISKQHRIYRTKGIDMFKDGVSVPSLATKWLYLESETDQFSIPLISKKNADLHSTIRKNIVGGPSIVFHRYHEKDKTVLREHEFGSDAKMCKSIYGFDANALYLYCAMQKLPTGPIIRRRKEDNFFPKFSDYFGQLSLEWLEYEAKTMGIYIRHKFNKGEQRVGQHNLPVDGFCKELNIVFQFHGCLFHGCKLKDCPITQGMCINPVNNKPLANLQSDTQLKEMYIKELGYELKVIYECQWNEFKKSISSKSFVNSLFSGNFLQKKTVTKEEILEAVKTDMFYGFIECDIHVPKSLEFDFSEMPPIFKHVTLSRNDLSDEMRAFSMTHNILNQPQSSLVGSFFGKKILVLSSLLRWYLQHNLIVTEIYQVVQFHGHKCFVNFADSVCSMRREADADISKKIIADTSKLCGNVIYGATITDKERFTDVKYLSDPDSVSRLVNCKRFISMDELDDDIFEIQLSKQRIKLDTPIVIGFSILQLAKLRMLEFYYDLMCKFVHRKDFQYVTMDTDSAYFATSNEFESIVIPEKKRQFYQEYDKWFVPPFCDRHKSDFIETKLKGNTWFKKSCCEKSLNFHKRTPGLFKQEWKGNGIIALNSKTYFCFGENGQKLSTKGLNKNHNSLQKKEFLNVLKNKQIVKGTNRGIMRKNKKILTYSQVKSGLNYFYAKRRVLSDGVTTYPLYK